MRKLFFTSLIFFGIFVCSCSNDQIADDKEQSKEIKPLADETQNKEPFIAYSVGKGPTGLYAEGGEGTFGPDNDRWTHLRDGGNCIQSGGSCITKSPPHYSNSKNGPEVEKCYECIFILDPEDPEDPKDPEYLKKIDQLTNTYLTTVLIDLTKNLNKEDLTSFKQSMRFINDKTLADWDMILLEKGTKENFVKVIKQLSYDLTGDNRMIIITNPDNKERIIK